MTRVIGEGIRLSMFETFKVVAVVLIVGAIIYFSVDRILKAFKIGDPVRPVALWVVGLGTIIYAVIKSGLVPGL